MVEENVFAVPHPFDKNSFTSSGEIS